MAGFFYFTEDEDVLDGGSVSPLFFDRHNLVPRAKCDIPRDAIHSRTVGPSGKAGHYLYFKTAGKPPQNLAYNAKTQEWINRGDLWIGWDKGNPPTPKDVVKPNAIAGFILHDEHEQQWILPIVYAPEGRTTLPIDYSFDNDCRVIKVRKPGYEDIWQLGCEALDFLMVCGAADADIVEEKWPEEKVIAMAVEFLGVNYFVGPHEVVALLKMGRGILDINFSHAVLRAVTDFGHVQESADYVKKKQKTLLTLLPDLSKPSPGPTDASLDIDPHSDSLLSQV